MNNNNNRLNQVCCCFSRAILMVKSGGRAWLLAMEEQRWLRRRQRRGPAAHHSAQQDGAPRSQHKATPAGRILLFRTACLSALRRTSFAASVPRMVVQLVESLRICRRGFKKEEEKRARKKE